uniref:Mitochondrial import receptor subunit TOM7 homolog n=1 Tax=Syphacia muris TaxID=451379 RepID=A0A0N5AWH7_9BILA
MELTDRQAKFITKCVDLMRFGIQWGFVPVTLYLGFKRGADPSPNGQVVPLTLLSILWG